MKKLLKNIYRLLIVLVVIFSLAAGLTTKAATGYMYSSDGKLIECSAGFTITSEGIYSVLSDAWKGLKDDNGGDVSVFNSPSDMCLYDDKETGNQILYVVDSSSNYLFIFDQDIKYKATIKEFKVDPSKFINSEGNYTNELVMMNTAGDAAKTNKKLWTASVISKYQEDGTLPTIKGGSHELAIYENSVIF